MAPGRTLQSDCDVIDLRILCTTDLHAQLRQFDYIRDRALPLKGLAIIAPLIHAARTEQPNSILLDNGDCLQGSPMADLLASGAPEHADDDHPVIQAMNLLHYDAATLGNHDFNYGLPFLRETITQAEFPHVLANVVRTRGGTVETDVPLLPPYCLLERSFQARSGETVKLTIGVLGLAPFRTIEWDRYHLEGRVEGRGILEAARFWVPRMRQQGADIVVALCHSGPGQVDDPDNEENAALAVAALDGVDAVVTGHTHKILPGPDYAGTPGIDAARGLLADTPAVQAGSHGSCVGVIDLALRIQGDGALVCQDATSEIRTPQADLPEDTTLLDASEAIHNATRVKMRRNVGHAGTALTSYFPQLALAPALQMVADAQLWQARKLLNGQASDVPLLSVATPFAAGGTKGPENYVAMQAGEIDARHIAELSPFPNNLHVIDVDGRTLRLWLERVAVAFATVPPGAQDVPLLNAGMAIYNCDVIYGLNYEFDLAEAPSFDVHGVQLRAPEEFARVKELRYDGTTVKDDDHFLVAVNGYRAAGGGRFDMLRSSRALAYCAEPLVETITRYVQETSPVAAALHPVMTFSKLGATAILAGSPAAEMSSTQGAPKIERLEQLDAEGFARFRVTL